MPANAFSLRFEPIVNTKVRRIIGHKCLIRPAGASTSLAIRALTSHPNPGTRFFLPFVPSAIAHPSEILEHTNPRPANIVMEAAGCNRNPDIVHLRGIGNYLRNKSIGFALDDVANNAEALRLIVDVRPDYIKLEKHQVSERLVEVAERLSVRVIAKHVERVSTMEQLWSAGVHCMQGHLFGSPSPEMTWTHEDSHLSRLPSREPLDPYHTAPILTNLNQQLLAGIGVP